MNLNITGRTVVGVMKTNLGDLLHYVHAHITVQKTSGMVGRYAIGCSLPGARPAYGWARVRARKQDHWARVRARKHRITLLR